MTLVNVFTVKAEDQQQLVDLLVEATEQTMKHLPGFLSANIHRLWHQVNYAQWRTKEDFEAMQGPSAVPHMKGRRARLSSRFCVKSWRHCRRKASRRTAPDHKPEVAGRAGQIATRHVQGNVDASSVFFAPPGCLMMNDDDKCAALTTPVSSDGLVAFSECLRGGCRGQLFDDVRCDVQ